MDRLTTLLVCLVMLAAAGCGSDDQVNEVAVPDALNIEGEVEFTGDLPGDATARIQLRTAEGGDAVARLEQPVPAGAQSVPFTLQVERAQLETNARYQMEADVLAGGRVLRSMPPREVDTGADSIDAGALSLTPVEAASHTFVCGDEQVTLSVEEDGAWLSLAGNRYEMRRVVSASGSRYQALDDDDIVFWEKGERASLEFREADYPECIRAQQGERAYSATGTEPGWHLEIGPETFTLEAYYGETRISGETPEPEVAGDTTTYRLTTRNHEVTVDIVDTYCTNAMSGMPYPDQVTVTLDGNTFDGCGGDPAALLAANDWRLASLDGRDVEAATPTLVFGEDRSLTGDGGCNRYRGSYALTGEGIEISPLSATRMSCSPEVDDLEQRFLEQLEATRRFYLEDGTLVLETDDGRTLRAQPAAAL